MSNENEGDKSKSGFEDDPNYTRQRYIGSNGICNHPEHNMGDMLIHIPKGKRYRHVCPACGESSYMESNDKTSEYYD